MNFPPRGFATSFILITIFLAFLFLGGSTYMLSERGMGIASRETSASSTLDAYIPPVETVTSEYIPQATHVQDLAVAVDDTSFNAYEYDVHPTITGTASGAEVISLKLELKTPWEFGQPGSYITGFGTVTVPVEDGRWSYKSPDQRGLATGTYILEVSIPGTPVSKSYSYTVWPIAPQQYPNMVPSEPIKKTGE